MASEAAFGMLIGLGMCVLLPLAIVGACLYVVTKKARDRHAERMAMIERGLVPPPDGSTPAGSVTASGTGVPASAATPVAGPSRIHARAEFKREPDPARTVGFAVGLLVTGVLWFATEMEFSALLIGIGAAYLTRGIIGLRRDPAPPGAPAAPAASESFPGGDAS